MAVLSRFALSALFAGASLCLSCAPALAQIDPEPTSAAADATVPTTAEAEMAYAQDSGIVFTAIKAEAADRVNESDHLSCDSKMARLLDSPQGREVLARRIPDVVSDPRIVMARGLTLKQLAKHKQTGITPEMLAEIDQDLSQNAAR